MKSQAQVIDQIIYPKYIEYVIRIDGIKDFRVQTDGTIADLQTKISAKLKAMATPPLVSEIPTGNKIDLTPEDIITLPIIPAPKDIPLADLTPIK